MADLNGSLQTLIKGFVSLNMCLMRPDNFDSLKCDRDCAGFRPATVTPPTAANNNTAVCVAFLVAKLRNWISCPFFSAFPVALHISYCSCGNMVEVDLIVGLFSICSNKNAH